MAGLYKSDKYIQDLRNISQFSIDFTNIKNCSVLVTGATGLVGSVIVDALAQSNVDQHSNIKIYATSRSIEKVRTRFSDRLQAGVIPVELDVSKHFDIDFDVDYIIHAASNSDPQTFTNDPVGTILSNVLGSYQLLLYAKTKQIKRILYVSTGEIYGVGSPEIVELDENYSGYVNTLSVRSCYPGSKRAAETLFTAFLSQYNVPFVIARLSHTYGPSMTCRDSRATAQFFRNVLRGEDICLKSPGKQLRSYTYVADAVSAIFSILQAGKTGQAYNVAYKDSVLSIAEFASLVAQMSGRNVTYDKTPDSLLQSPIVRQVLSTKKLESLGWKGIYTPAVGIARTIEILSC